MPLSEISSNIRRNDSQGSKLRSEGLPSPKTWDSMPPRGVQSMLRTTTEIGDIGQFSVKSSRLPRVASRLAMARPRSGSFDSSVARLRHPNATSYQGRARRQGPRQMRSFTNMPRPDAVHSNLMSCGPNPRPMIRASRPYPPSFEYLASPSLGSQSLYSHRSLMTLRSQPDYRSMHSSSPGGVVSQTRLPGQRAPSPAFSDVPGYGPPFRPPYSRTGSVASSPSSLYPKRRRNVGYVPDMNNSYTSFARLPSPAIPLSYAGTSIFRPPSRATTPGSFHDPRGASNVSLASSMRTLPKSPTGSSTPAYYDYSESFIEENCLFPDGQQQATSLPFTIDQTIHEHGPPPTHPRAHTPFGIRPGSIYNPSELPTSHNRTPSVTSKCISPVISPAVVPKRTSSLIPVAAVAGRDMVVISTSLVEVQEANELKPSTAESANVSIEDPDPGRVSTVSNASRLSSHPSTFFPNASRSPRNLTNLAARVHSPGLGQVQKEPSIRQLQCQVEKLLTVASSTTQDPPKDIFQNWQLPSLKFRPFSLISSVPCPSDRPRTSSSVPARAGTAELISPTPERPMSSQSRKRFSKILDIDDDFTKANAKPLKRSFNSLNFMSLKRVDEIPDSTYPIRFSIPPFSPLKAFTGSDSTEQDEGASLSTPIRARNQTTNPERSTVESLLDRHIEALGLMPETSDDENTISTKYNGIHFLSGTTDDAFTALATSLGKKPLARCQSLATTPSYYRSSLGSPEKRRLMPRKLFASFDMGAPKLPSLHSAPHLLGLMPGIDAPDWPSYGWQTLASSSQLGALQSSSRTFSNGSLENDQDKDAVKRFSIRRRSALSLSPTTSSGWPQSIRDLPNWDRNVPIRKYPRKEFDRKASHRRRQRVRLKRTCTSRDLAMITAMEVAETTPNAQTAPKDAQKQDCSKRTTIEINGPAELDSRPIEGIRGTSTSPKIPHRWSSLINVVQQPYKRSLDVVRRPSIHTMRSNLSISSLAEPINSTRFAARSPHMVSQTSTAILAPPDLGPPLHASTLNLSIPYAPEPSTIRPTICETRSFFSNNSSGSNNKTGASGGTGTLQKKLGLHSLRKVVPASPSASKVQRAVSAKHIGKRFQVHHFCNDIAGTQKSFDEDDPLAGTVGMSEFAYRKRRMMQKVKDWWVKQCVQKKLVGTLRRKKSAA